MSTEERLAVVETKLDAMNMTQESMRADVKSMSKQMSETKGGWRMLVLMMSASGIGGFAAAKLSALFGFLPH